MTIAQLYQKYKIMPNLQQHMLRVAAIAYLICEAIDTPVDTTAVTAACLLHDMGNILKFDLTRYPHFLEPYGLRYWEDVKAEYQERYGDDEHLATTLIIEEIGATSRIQELVRQVSFTAVADEAEILELEHKICEYADMRVAPEGITSLQERLDDLDRRYAPKYPGEEHQLLRAKFRDQMIQIEQELFSQIKKTQLRPSQLTNETVNDTIEVLKSMVIPT